MSEIIKSILYINDLSIKNHRNIIYRALCLTYSGKILAAIICCHSKPPKNKMLILCLHDRIFPFSFLLVPRDSSLIA